MKLQEVLTKTTNFFKEKSFDSPRLDAELLLSHGLGLDRVQLYLKFDQPLSETELENCRSLVKRRVQGEPVAYILGYKYFFGSQFKVTKDTLIPRPETEELVEYVLGWIQKNNISVKSIIDLGSGTGCIGLSLIKNLTEAHLWSIDISSNAAQVAKENALALGLEGRAAFVVGDAAGKASEAPTAQIIVGNPPYIAEDDPEVDADVKKFEPQTALFTGDQGLRLLKDWSKAYAEKLESPGLLVFEMGYRQGPAMLAHFQGLGVFKEVRVIKDLSGHDRFIVGEK